MMQDEPISSKFFDTDRNAIVDDLVARFREVERGKGSQLATLVAPPGWGKTRIVHELYARLASEQPAPRYWPDSIQAETEFDMRGIFNSRNCVYPRHLTRIVDRAKMTYMWLGLSCDLRHGIPTDALKDAASQINDHAIALELARTMKFEAAKTSLDATGAVVTILGLLGVVVVPPLGIAVSAVGLAKLGWDKRDLPSRVKEWLSNWKGVEREIGRDERERTIVLAKQIERLSDAVPIVIIVDNAHWADQRLLDLLGRVLTASEGRVLLITTTWPHTRTAHDNLAGHGEFFRNWFNELQLRMRDKCNEVTLSPLSNKALSQLFESEVPGTNAELRGLILERVDRNPLLLRMVLRMERVAGGLKRGKLSPDAIAILPSTILDAVSQYWEEFSTELKIVLALAAYLGTDFVTNCLAEAAEARVISSLDEALNQGIALAWTRVIDGPLQQFGERALYDVTRERSRSLLDEPDEARLRESVALLIQSDEFEDLPTQAKRALWMQHVLFAQDPEIFDTDRSLASKSAFEMADLIRGQFQLAKSLEFYELAAKWLTSKSISDMTAIELNDYRNIHSHYAHTLQACNRPEEAIQHFQNALEARREMIEENKYPNESWTNLRWPEQSWITRCYIAECLASTGKGSEAIVIYQALLGEMRTSNDDSSKNLELLVSSYMANVLYKQNEFLKAREMFQEVLEKRLHGAPLVEEEIVETKANILKCDARLDSLEGAIAGMQKILRDIETFPSSVSTDVIASCRSWLAHWLADAGQDSLALQEFEKIDSLYVGLQRRSPRVLVHRKNFAMFLARSGRTDFAVSKMSKIIDDLKLTSDPTNRDTLNIKYELAKWLRESGGADRAIELLRDLLSEEASIAEAESWRLSVLTYELAELLIDASRITEAEQVVQSLLDRDDVAPYYRFFALKLMGEIEYASEEYEKCIISFESARALLELDTRFSEHQESVQETLITLGSAYYELENTDRAIECFQDCLHRQLQDSSVENDERMIVLDLLSSCLFDARRFDDAIGVYESLKDAESVVYGSLGTETIISRQNLALAKYSAGRGSDASNDLEELLTELLSEPVDRNEIVLEVKETIGKWRVGSSGE
jgi:tetratricopeptide (TPR) repeat protein